MDCVIAQDVPDINVGNISNRIPQIAILSKKKIMLGIPCIQKS